MINELRIATDLARSSGKPELIEYSFETNKGSISVLAELVVSGTSVTLNDVCIYPESTMKIKRGAVLRELLDQKTLLITALASGSSVRPNIGNPNENSKTKPPLALVKLFKLLDRHPDLLNTVRAA